MADATTTSSPATHASEKDEVSSILSELGLTSDQMATRSNAHGDSETPIVPDPLADLAESADALLRQMGTEPPAAVKPAGVPSPALPTIEALDEHLADAVDSMLASERETPLPPPDPSAGDSPPPLSFDPIAPTPVKDAPVSTEVALDSAPPKSVVTNQSDPGMAQAADTSGVATTAPTVPATPQGQATAPPVPAVPMPKQAVPAAVVASPNPKPDTPAKASKSSAVQTAKGLGSATAKQGHSVLKAIEPSLLKTAAAISKPLDGKSKSVRDIVAATALITLFWALCVWAYALIWQPPAGPSAPKAHEEAAADDGHGGGGHGGGGHGAKDDGHGAKKDDGHGAKKKADKKPDKKAAKKDSHASGGGH